MSLHGLLGIFGGMVMEEGRNIRSMGSPDALLTVLKRKLARRVIDG